MHQHVILLKFSSEEYIISTYFLHLAKIFIWTDQLSSLIFIFISVWLPFQDGPRVALGRAPVSVALGRALVYVRGPIWQYGIHDAYV
jgi:hypothetical protein